MNGSAMTRSLIVNVDHLDKLRKIYPRLFMEDDMPWSFDHGPGWDSIIEGLCGRIDAIMQEVPQGSITIKQIKQKLGGLRFYYSLQDVDEMRSQAICSAVKLAGAESELTCEQCGSPSYVRHTSQGMMTLCRSCSDAMEQDHAT